MKTSHKTLAIIIFIILANYFYAQNNPILKVRPFIDFQWPRRISTGINFNIKQKYDLSLKIGYQSKFLYWGEFNKTKESKYPFNVLKPWFFHGWVSSLEFKYHVGKWQMLCAEYEYASLGKDHLQYPKYFNDGKDYYATFSNVTAIQHSVFLGYAVNLYPISFYAKLGIGYRNCIQHVYYYGPRSEHYLGPNENYDIKKNELIFVPRVGLQFIIWKREKNKNSSKKHS